MAEQEKSSGKTPREVNEISLYEIFDFIKKYAVRVATSGFIFGVLGYATSFLMPVAYQSSSVLLPESISSTNALGSLSSLARLGGLTKNETSGAIQPDLYPTILETVPFSLYLLKQPILGENNHLYKTLQSFLHRNDDLEDHEKESDTTKHNVGKDILSLSKVEKSDSRRALKLILTTYDVKTGIVTISAESPDPVVSAQLVKLASDYLIKYVSDYRAQKTTREVQFLGERVLESKKREESAEYALQSYRDRNRGAFLNVARIEEQRLQAEYLLTQTLYSELVRKWEDAKIKVKEEQPIFKVLEPAQVPLEKSKPKRVVVAMIFCLIGAIATLIILVFKENRYQTINIT